jgi:predicted DNA-binding protein YlxM (UPF0122 family)
MKKDSTIDYLNITNIKYLYSKITPSINVNFEKFKNEVEFAVLTMTERQQTVFDLIYNKRLHKREIAMLLMISRSRIYQIDKIIIRKLIMRIKYISINSGRNDKIINNETLLSEIDFSIRFQNCLRRYFGINATLNDLLLFIDGNPKRILEIRNVGERTLYELEVFLRILKRT